MIPKPTIIKGLPTYRESDLEFIAPIAYEAKVRMYEYIDRHKLRDGGTCVLGECIKIYILRARKRLPQPYELVGQPFQGNNHTALKVAQEYLESQGVECRYDCGRMD